MARPAELRPLDQFLRLAVRAYGGQPRPEPETYPWPDEALIFDTETTVDATQALLFGCYRYLRGGACVEEGIFYREGLPASLVERIEAFGRQQRADVVSGVDNALNVYPLSIFLERVFCRVAEGVRGAIVGFNMPFDLSRLAFGASEGRKAFAGGFSLKLFSYAKDGELRVNPYRPRVGINNIDSKRALLGLTAVTPDDGDKEPDDEAKDTEGEEKRQLYGPLLDLRTLAFALTNESHNLESACEAFGVPYRKQPVELGVVNERTLRYCREDVSATAALYRKLLEEYERHPIDLPPARAYSPASIGKAYLRAMGVRPRLRQQPDFPLERLGQAMVAYYGGRAECRIRRTAVPVAYVDFLSMYPTVCTLMGLWRLLTCEQVEVNDATDEVTKLLATVTLDDCFDREWWRQLVCLVRIQPDGDVLPVRAKYADNATWQIGLNPLQSREPLWYTLADCIASTLLTGKPPRVLEAVRFIANTEQMATLRTTSLRSSVAIDPRDPGADFFRTLIEQRHQLDQRPEAERERLDQFLKVLANSTSYGIFVELNQRHRKRRVKETLYGLAGEFHARVQHPERPGEFAFPPIAAAIAGAARLMLALLERLVRNFGGSYAFCDTDSMAIVATPDQTLVPCPGGSCRTEQGEEAVLALSFAEVEDIRERFRSLNPYDLKLVDESILELEKENYSIATKEPHQLYCYAISAKRYVLFNYDDSLPTIRRYSEHGLGHLLNPVDPEAGKDWIINVWQQLLAQHLTIEHPAPVWLDRPAIGRITVSTPELLKPFQSLNDAKPYDDWVKPFNFLLTAHVAPFGQPTGTDPTHFQLVAPWARDPAQWLDLDWIDRYSGGHFRIRTTDDPINFDGIANVKNMAQVLADYSVRREPKSAGRDGRPCQRDTLGVLQRRPVVACTITHIGKEANQLEEIEAQVIHDPDEVIAEYPDDRRDPWHKLVLPVLAEMATRDIELASGLNRSTIKRIRTGVTTPHRVNRLKLTRIAATFARQRVAERGFVGPRDDLLALRAYIHSAAT